MGRPLFPLRQAPRRLPPNVPEDREGLGKGWILIRQPQVFALQSFSQIAYRIVV